MIPIKKILENDSLVINKNIVMTGATSFIGVELARKLLLQGYSVFAIVRAESLNISLLPEHECFHCVQGELEHIEEAVQDLPNCSVFIHLGWDGVGSAGRSDVQIQEKNVKNSLKALYAAKALCCKKFIFAGSQAEYGIHHDIITEKTKCVPVSEYGKAKLRFGKEGAEVCNALALEFIHLRIFSVYGQADHPWTLIKSCVDAFLQGKAMRLGPCTAQWNFLYIADMAECMLKIIESGADIQKDGGVFNVAGSDTRILKDFVKEIYDLCGRRGSCEFGTVQARAEGQAELKPNIEKVCRVFDWRPKTSFAEGISLMIENSGENII
ncbi:MAG: NAD(P)-dependent oxidoreductase [Christensenella sp.]